MDFVCLANCQISVYTKEKTIKQAGGKNSESWQKNNRKQSEIAIAGQRQFTFCPFLGLFYCMTVCLFD